MDERRAIGRLKGGDPGGLEALVKAHQVGAVRAAYLVCRDRSLAEDVVQGAFVKAYEKIGGFDERRSFGPWFNRIVVNDAIKAASRRERTTRYEGASPGTIKWRLHAARRRLSKLLRPRVRQEPAQALSGDATEGGGDRG